MSYTEIDNKEKIIEAIKNNELFIFPKASDRLKDDRDVAMLAVWYDGNDLKYVSNRLQDDKEVVMTAIWSASGEPLQYASDRLKDDPEVVMAAVNTLKRCDNDALKYASDSLQDDIDIIMSAVRLDSTMLKYASKRLQADPRIQYLANQDFRFIDERWLVVKAYLMGEPDLNLLASFDNLNDVYILALSWQVGEIEAEALPELDVTY